MPPIQCLIIEDNKIDQRLIARMIEDGLNDKIHMIEAETLQDAVTRLKSDPVDVVIVDLFLPDSTGLETFLKLRQAFPKVPIVVFTSSPDMNMALMAIENGADDYLVKGQNNEKAFGRSILFAMARAKYRNKLR